MPSTLWQRACTPNEKIPRTDTYLIMVAWCAIWLVYWSLARPAVFPSPIEVVQAFPDLWLTQGLGQELWASWVVNLEALVLSCVIALPLAYLSRTPAIAPLAEGASKLRFLSPVVFFLPLLFLAPSGHALKVLMLTSGMVFFLLTSMLDIVASIPSEQFDDARTLRLSEWQATWYVVVRGTLDQLLDQLRNNAAMGWAAVMFVEGIVRSEGGIGVMLIDQTKHFSFADAWAIAIAVVIVGWGQDWLLTMLKQVTCPWAAMKVR